LGDNLARNVGLDFGTTNSALAILDQGAAPQLAGFPGLSGTAPSFRSILFSDAYEQGLASGVPIAGAEAISRSGERRERPVAAFVEVLSGRPDL